MFIIKAFSYLPLWVLYLLSDFLFLMTYRLVGYRKKVVLANLKNSFPNKTDYEIKQITKQFYRNLCDFAVEMAKSRTLTPKEFKKRVVFTNMEVLNKYKDQTIMFMASHQFNWEWMQLSAALQFPFKIDYIYQPLNNSGFNNYMIELRSRFGANPINSKNAAREILRRNEPGRGFALVADQTPMRSMRKYWTNFLNQETPFFVGGETLAKLVKSPVVYFACKKVKRGHYAIKVVEIANPPYVKGSHSIMETYVKAVEEVINNDPSGWLWSHKRWKYSREEVGE